MSVVKPLQRNITGKKNISEDDIRRMKELPGEISKGEKDQMESDTKQIMKDWE